MIGHYIVAKSRHQEGYTLIFGKVVSINKNIVEGHHVKNEHISKLRLNFEVPKADVVLDLGTNPHPGSVYKFDTSLLSKGSKQDNFFGQISFFYKPNKDILQKILKAFVTAGAILKKAGFAAPEHSVWEVFPSTSKGKWAGSYTRSPKPEKNPHRFCIKPESMPESEYVYVILHEFVHHLHAENMTGVKLNAAWIKLYNTSIKTTTIKKEICERLCAALLSSADRPSDFKKGLDEENLLAFNHIIRAIRADHSLTIRELDTLFEADAKDEISLVWPKKSLSSKDLAPVLTEYACVAYYELIAEAVSHYLIGRTLPANIKTLVEKSLSFARANMEKP